ncbi:MAG: hypothetical protein O7C75_03130 [Verrucomicrobia bacterium]|nr:hypothetical protein [Verrucomicrobiota bacterium]
MKNTISRLCSLSVVLMALSFLSPQANGQAIAVRNDVPRVGQKEVLMLRHAFIEKGEYQKWKQASRDGVWPWYEKLGSRVVGDWQVIYPQEGSQHPELDEALRLARYASYEHWQATRGSAARAGDTGGSVKLAGNGPDSRKSRESIALRGTVSKGSKGGIFLQGYMAETRPIYMPGTGESFEFSTDAVDDVIAVRHDVARPGEQILELRYWKIRKGSFEEFHVLTRDGTWPYLEKIGVRPVGQWRVAYLPTGTPVESPDFDEVYMLARYASYEHWQATQDPVRLGGNGPDFQMLQNTRQKLDALSQETSAQFLRGPMYASPPKYLPALDEKYRKVD